MKNRIIGLVGILISVGLIVGALVLMYNTYNRVNVPINSAGEPLQVQGVLLEKLVEQRSDRLLPFDVTTYIVRYAFPNAQGQMRTGEQIVTKRVYESFTRQGELTWVFISGNDPSVNAIDTQLVFPGTAGWRMGIALGSLILATILSAVSAVISKMGQWS